MCFFCLWPFCHRLLGDGRSATETFPRSWGGFCPLLAASQEIVCLSIPGFRLHLRFWERPCSRKKKIPVCPSAILRGDRPKPCSHDPNQCHLPGASSHPLYLSLSPRRKGSSYLLQPRAFLISFLRKNVPAWQVLASPSCGDHRLPITQVQRALWSRYRSVCYQRPAPCSSLEVDLSLQLQKLA